MGVNFGKLKKKLQTLTLEMYFWRRSARTSKEKRIGIK
jgi:hypothetical protein